MYKPISGFLISIHAVISLAAAAFMLQSCDCCSCCSCCCGCTCGCQPAGGPLRVDFDMSLSPGADPEGMAVLFYDVGESGYRRFDYRVSGGSADMPPGECNVVTFNNDTYQVLITDDSDFSTISATTRPTAVTAGLGYDYHGAMPPPGRDGGEPVLESPDMMWGTSLRDHKVKAGADTLILKPRRIVCRYTVEVNGVVNISSVSAASMSISGLAGSYLLGELSPGGDPCVVPGAVSRVSDSELRGQLLTFGRHADAGRSWLRMFVWLRDGQKKVFEWDVTDQIDFAQDPFEVRIRVDGVILPDVRPPDGGDIGGGGIGVDVDNWEVVDIELST